MTDKQAGIGVITYHPTGWGLTGATPAGCCQVLAGSYQVRHLPHHARYILPTGWRPRRRDEYLVSKLYGSPTRTVCDWLEILTGAGAGTPALRLRTEDIKQL